MLTIGQARSKLQTGGHIAATRWYGFQRWLYRSGRPSRLARVMNRIQVIVQEPGLIMPERLVTMEVPGRRTGRLLSFPLVVADHEGERYLVAMLGENAEWPRNVRAAGGRAVLRHGRREPVRLEEITDPAARAPVIRRYLDYAPGARPHVPVDRHAPVEEFERIAPQIPVFRIVPDPSR